LPSEEDLETLRGYVVSFPQRCQEKFKWWKNKLQELRFNSIKTVFWGSGSKGVSFLTTLNVGEQIEYVVDINPYRQGHFMSGTGQRIVASDYLKHYQPDYVVVMNDIYKEEIEETLGTMKLESKVLCA
jgi:predicted phosphatase